MIGMVFAMIMNVTIALSPVKADNCENLGPRVDGITVKVCSGHVVSMTDAAGNTVEYPYHTAD